MTNDKGLITKDANMDDAIITATGQEDVRVRPTLGGADREGDRG